VLSNNTTMAFLRKKTAAVLITTGKAMGIMYTTCTTWKMFLGKR